jgi:TonB-dependent starch-binding outer membrane protein SusC
MKWNKILVLGIAVCLSLTGYGQKESKKSDKPFTVTGKVMNRDNKPVGGAVIYVDNIVTNSSTKSNGSYKIKVSPSASRIEVRSTGFKSSEKAIEGKTDIDFILESENEGEIVKGTADNDGLKKSSGARGKKINTYNDIYQMIRGEVSGVMVSGRSITIQQGHSFFGSSTPLFVVNGVKVMSIDNINPLEVKSIHVLKGTSAAIYGTEGSNGVLSITLKNGTEKEE